MSKKLVAQGNIISIYFCSKTMSNCETGLYCMKAWNYNNHAEWRERVQALQITCTLRARDGGKKGRRTEVKHKLLRAEMEPCADCGEGGDERNEMSRLGFKQSCQKGRAEAWLNYWETMKKGVSTGFGLNLWDLHQRGRRGTRTTWCRQ